MFQDFFPRPTLGPLDPLKPTYWKPITQQISNNYSSMFSTHIVWKISGISDNNTVNVFRKHANHVSSNMPAGFRKETNVNTLQKQQKTTTPTRKVLKVL